MDGSVAVEDFLNTGRTGRRNAVPDISEVKIGTMSTAGMDAAFDKLNVTDSDGKSPGPSSSHTSGNENQSKS
ncbi:hypothetical protein Btru_041646 [Bulinus truncatus]|nr:hypothetical protein Btru_041646 [Bulinus truncatus]